MVASNHLGENTENQGKKALGLDIAQKLAYERQSRVEERDRPLNNGT